MHPPASQLRIPSVAMTTSTFVIILAIAGWAYPDAPQGPAQDVRPGELLKLIDRADRIVVREIPRSNSPILFESQQRRDLDELKASLLKASLKLPPPEDWIRCGCSGSPAIYLFSGDQQVGLITNQHGEMIRYDRWESDAPLADPSPFLDWFEKRGMAGPREEYARQRKVLETFGAAQKKWIEAMPSAVRPVWEAALKAGRWFKEGELREALARGIPDRDERIRAVFAWYGSGMGQWSGFPAYEMFAEELLLEYPTTELIAALGGRKLIVAELEGAARLFGTWSFSSKRPKDLSLLPADLKRQLRMHCLASPEGYKRKAAETTFKE
jgi:hypothetical protein